MARVHPLEHFRGEQEPPLSRAALAKLVGVSRSYMTRLENGERNPSLTLAAKLSETTGIPIDSFVKQDEAAQ